MKTLLCHLHLIRNHNNQVNRKEELLKKINFPKPNFGVATENVSKSSLNKN